MKLSYKIVILVVVVIVLGFIANKTFFVSKNKKTVNSTTVQKGNLSKTLTISGKIDADEKVTLRFQTGGRLTWVGVKEGDYVQKYQSVASLDQRELKKKLEKYLNDYIKYRDDYDQTKLDTYKDQAMTNTIKRIYEKSQADLNKSVLDVELQDITLQYANLWTPIEGLVTKVSMPYAGTNIYLPTQAEFEIINPKTIYFSATADQTEITSLYEGLAGELTLDSYPNATLSGVIKNISFIPKEGETGTVYDIKFLFNSDNTGNRYKIGMAGDLALVLETKNNVLYIPLIYLKEENNKKYVQIKKNAKIEKEYVTTGMENDDNVEITSGVSEGETIYD